eukprot:4902464-Pyramimonas_sp.AAC.1
MVWAATARPDTAAVPLALLEAWWRRAVTETGVVKQWSKTPGPLQRAALSVQRAGWQTRTGFLWINHRGDEVHVGQLTPGLLEMMLRQGLAVQHEKALAEKWDMQPYTRVTFDIPRRHVKSRKFNKYQKFCIMNCA